MKEAFYGSITRATLQDDIDRYVEEIFIKGYTIIPELLSDQECKFWRNKIDTVYAKQEEEFSRDALIAIQEIDVCRAPLLYDFGFAEMARIPKITAVIKRILGEWFILNLQNVIINRPDSPHHQSAWHRDLAYQNFVISRPIAVNALIAIDNFTEKTGGTHLLPFSHKNEVLPSAEYIDANRLMTEVPAGSAILFDAMLFHRAGVNRSSIIRRGVNHLYTTAIIKQQYDFPRALAGTKMDEELEQLLGFHAQVPLNAVEWRRARAARLKGEPK